MGAVMATTGTLVAFADDGLRDDALLPAPGFLDVGPVPQVPAVALGADKFIVGENQVEDLKVL